MNRPILYLVTFLVFPIFSSAQVDTVIGITAPKTSDYKELAHSLCDGLGGEKEKANAIYNWITHNISYDVKAMNKLNFKPEDKAEKALKNRLAVCEGYAMLFTELCREAGLKAVNIDGYAKDWIFDNGDSLYIPRHMWAAVEINGQWWLNDPTWGAGGLVQSPGVFRKILNKVLRQKNMYATKLKFRFKYDTSYFMVNPETFRFKHLPTDPKWQLTDTIMPLQLFEAGDSAIGQFNALCKPMQSDPDLERIAGLDEKQKLFEYADRAYKYNPRFPVVLALKQTYRAEAQVIKAFTDSSVENGILLINDAENGLMKSQGYIKEQKKSFPDKYTRLKKKNTTKDQEAKKTIRQITTDNKRLISESKKYTNSAKSKDKRVKTKYTATKKRTRGLDPQKINGQAASKNQKKPGAPELREIRDSVAARNKQIAEMKYTLDEKVDVIAKLQNKNSERLDSLALLLGTTDSVLVRQAIARINMHDDYDNEVILLNRLFKELKYQQADTLQKYYLVCYDTITSMHEQRQKMQLAQMDMYKKNLRNLEQYGKWCSADTTIAAQYVDMVKDYTECINSYIKDLAAYDAYVKANKKLFSGIEKLSKRQLKISAYMVKVEGCRKKLEEKKIKENQAFDTKENERQQLAVKDLLEQLQEISSGKVD